LPSIVSERDALSHEDVNDLEEGGIAVKVKADFVQNSGFLGHQLVLLTVESHIVVVGVPVQRVHPVLIRSVILLLFSRRGLIAGHLAKEPP